MNIPKYMKMKLITVFTYFASSLFLNLVENKNIDEPKTKITNITPNPNTGVSSQISTTPVSVADIHALLDSLKAKNPENEYRLGVAEAGLHLILEIQALRQKLESRRELHEKELEHKNEELMNKDTVIREWNVLNFIRTHMESFSLQADPLYYTIKKSSASTTSLVTMNKDNILPEDIPATFNGRLESDFKNAYSRWYRIIKNSEDFRIKVFLKTIRKEHLHDKGLLTDQDIAKTLAIIWCTVCNNIRSLLGGAKGQVIWKDENEVANAFATFEENGYYVDVVRIFFKETKFMESLSVTKKVD